MFTLMKENLVQEVTILSQNIKKKTQRAVAVIEDYNGDDVLSLLEKYANSMIYMRFIRRISSYGVSERDRRDGFF